MEWKVEKFETSMDGLGEATGVRVVSSEGEVICDNEPYYPQELDPQHAHLIAAAPELLAALKAMVLNDAHTYRDCHKASLLAIAKAEGRT